MGVADLLEQFNAGQLRPTLIGDQQMIAVELKHFPSGIAIFDGIHE